MATPANQQFDIKEIMEALPHRYPFLLVDKIVSLNLENGEILGQKNVTMNELFFQGHFPGSPIMPGVLVLEALAQTGAFLVGKKVGTSKVALLLHVNAAKFRRPVYPGDILMLRCKGVHFTGRAGKVKGEALVNDKIVVEAELGFALVNQEKV